MNGGGGGAEGGGGNFNDGNKCANGGGGGNMGGRGEIAGERSWSFGSGQFFNFSNLFLREMSSPGGLGAFFIRLLARSFLPTSTSFVKEPTIEFSASNK